MAYVTPGTVAAGDVATAAAWNVITNDILQFAPFVQGVFTNEAARDAAITSPTEGMHAYLTASTVAAATGAITALPTGVQTIYNGSVWVCVTPIGAGSNTSATTTSTSYVTTLTGDAVAISVTLSTGVSALVMINSQSSTSGVSDQFLSFSVSGATTLAVDNLNGARDISSSGGFGLTLSRSLIITGLTGGNNTFTLNYKTGSGTVTYPTRNLTVKGIA